MAQARHVGKVVLVPAQARVPVELRADAAYLVTGGMGALGLHAARWLVDHGARHLVLAGRSVPEDLSAVDKLREEATVDIERCDVTAADDVQRLVGSFGTVRPVLRGVIHAAGALHDGMLVRQRWPDFEKGLGAKVLGTWHLHRATRRMSLDFFVCYSSVASVIGSPGQGSYAAANAFMDSLAHARQAEGLPALSISWGAWQRGGMVARLAETDRARLTAEGFVPLSDSDADGVLDRLVGSKLAHGLGIAANWRTYVERHPHKRSLFTSLLPTSSETRTTTTPTLPGEPSINNALERLPADERLTMLARHVRTRVLKLVGLPADRAIDEQLGFREIGLDSLLAVELRNALQADLNLTLPATMAFDYPTVSSLADHLLTALGLANAAGATPEFHPNRADSAVDQVSIGDLSETEAEALLEAELEALARNSPRAN
jgi:NAD(P)-dependent dehydrogenase (short-subunit alcohol dehydrogenase family)/acyl carrier protein